MSDLPNSMHPIRAHLTVLLGAALPALAEQLGQPIGVIAMGWGDDAVVRFFTMTEDEAEARFARDRAPDADVTPADAIRAAAPDVHLRLTLDAVRAVLAPDVQGPPDTADSVIARASAFFEVVKRAAFDAHMYRVSLETLADLGARAKRLLDAEEPP